MQRIKKKQQFTKKVRINKMDMSRNIETTNVPAHRADPNLAVAHNLFGQVQESI